MQKRETRRGTRVWEQSNSLLSAAQKCQLVRDFWWEDQPPIPTVSLLHLVDIDGNE